jgi:hypothetical protein
LKGYRVLFGMARKKNNWKCGLYIKAV